MEADTGAIGGSYSHEFQVLAEAGEDLVFYSTESDYAANIEKATASGATAGPDRFQTLCCKNKKGERFNLILREDHTLNEVKAQKLPGLEGGFEVLAQDEANPIAVFVDPDAAGLAALKEAQVADLRNVMEGDASPDGKGVLKCARGIEVGHIFQLGDQYSKSMQMSVLNQDGAAVTPLMGCYGIGVTRIVAAAIEQHHDERGILWPAEMAPFQLAIVPLGYADNPEVKTAADSLYQQALHLGIEVVLDDRDERPGVKFADLDLIGIPHRIVIGERLLGENLFEYKKRGHDSVEKIDHAAMMVLFKNLI